MGDLLSKVGGVAQEAAFPRVPYPERPDIDPATGKPKLDAQNQPVMVDAVPPGTSSWIDRGLPLLGFLGGLTSPGGNPLGGYVRGRAVQQGIAHPYQERYAIQEGQQAYAQQNVAMLQQQIAQETDPQKKATLTALIPIMQAGLGRSAGSILKAEGLGGAQKTPSTALWSRAYLEAQKDQDVSEANIRRHAGLLADADLAAKAAQHGADQDAIERRHRETMAHTDSINTEFEQNQAAARERVKAKGGDPNDPASVTAEMQAIQGEKTTAIARANQNVKADMASGMSVAEFEKKNGVGLWNTETQGKAQALTPVGKQINTGKVVALSKEDDKDVREYLKQRALIDDVLKDMPEFEKYLAANPSIAQTVGTDGWLSSQAGQRLVETDQRIRHFASKLALLESWKAKQVFGMRASDAEGKRLAGYYGRLGAGVPSLTQTLKEARDSVGAQIGSILTLRPEDRDMLGIQAPPLTAPAKVGVHGYSQSEEDAAFGGK